MSNFNSSNQFAQRHIGPRDSDIQAMLKELGFSQLEEMASKVIPKVIRSQVKPNIGQGQSEFELLKTLKNMVSKKLLWKNFLMMNKLIFVEMQNIS